MTDETTQTPQQDFNRTYYESTMPGMTVEQALYILRQPYNSFPSNVRSKAVAIASAQQGLI